MIIHWQADTTKPSAQIQWNILRAGVTKCADKVQGNSITNFSPCVPSLYDESALRAFFCLAILIGFQQCDVVFYARAPYLDALIFENWHQS